MNDCVFYYDGGCRVLNRDNCVGCSFRKTEAEFKEGREKARERISNLPASQLAHIRHTYYKGNMQKVTAEWLE